MPDITKILQQAQQMQGRLKQIQDELEARTVNAASGGGMVTVEADGKGQIRKIKIDPTVVNASEGWRSVILGCLILAMLPLSGRDQSR